MALKYTFMDKLERRRGPRANVTAPLVVRHLDARKNAPTLEHMTRDISLAGAYFETDRPDAFQKDELVLASITIPEHERRAFPFARLVGRGRIVRVQELPPAQGAKRFGVAIEFGRDATALTAIPT